MICYNTLSLQRIFVDVNNIRYWQTALPVGFVSPKGWVVSPKGWVVSPKGWVVSPKGWVVSRKGCVVVQMTSYII